MRQPPPRGIRIKIAYFIPYLHVFQRSQFVVSPVTVPFSPTSYFLCPKSRKKASAYEKSCRCLGGSGLRNAEINQTRRQIVWGLAARVSELAQTWFLSGIFCLRPGLTRPNSGIFLRPVLEQTNEACVIA